LKQLVLLFLPLYILAQPSWFHNTPHKNYEIIAYGVDKDLQIARNIAKAEVSKQISIHISSNTNIKKSIDNGNYNKSISNNISTSSNATLQGIKILKEVKEDNIWYVSVVYDNRTLLQKIKSKQQYIKPSQIKKSYLNTTPLVKSIFKTLGFKTDINLIRKNNSWYLNISDNLFLLNRDNFIKLFMNTKNEYISFSTNKNIYKYPDNIQFKVNTKESGYVSILYSEENGKVGVLLNNMQIDKSIIYPKDNSEDNLIAYNPTNNTIQELYVTVYSKNKIDLDIFENVSDNLLDESNFSFDKLLDMINNNKFSTIPLKIKGNK
jgi:hypothetical protein